MDVKPHFYYFKNFIDLLFFLNDKKFIKNEISI
ncbi:MAG: hypothetical protein WJU30_00290 [Candidatus Phytoplasma pruni]